MRQVWRVIIAVVFGSIVDYALYVMFAVIVTVLSRSSFTIFVLMAAVPVGIYLLLPERWETRCRECGHVLRGLTEPGCPQCGERI